MTTDPIFYRLFETTPETFFLLLGMPADAALQMAACYRYQALEFKETAQRVDGVFLPNEPELPLYFLETQFYRLPNIFANLMAKVYTYLKRHDPGQAFIGVVLFADRSLEPKDLAPYQPLLDAGLIRRFYLEEMPELADAPLGMSILYLIRKTESEAPTTARGLIERVKTEVGDDTLRADLLELIETVIIYKLPRLSRKEIETMLQIHDIRESRVYQEAKTEGIQEGIQAGMKEGLKEGLKEGIQAGMKEGFQKGITNAIAKMAARNMPAEEIAAILEVDVQLVRQTLTYGNGD